MEKTEAYSVIPLLLVFILLLCLEWSIYFLPTYYQTPCVKHNVFLDTYDTKLILMETKYRAWFNKDWNKFY